MHLLLDFPNAIFLHKMDLPMSIKVTDQTHAQLKKNMRGLLSFSATLLPSIGS